jgi:hypothetical protein
MYNKKLKLLFKKENAKLGVVVHACHPNLLGRLDWEDGWMGGWMDGWVNGWVDGWMGGWMDGWVDGWIERQVDGWMSL